MNMYSNALFMRIKDLGFYDDSVKKERIVLIGYGWAGKAFAEHLNVKKYDLTILSKTDGMLNTTCMKKSLVKNDGNLFLPNEKIKKIETLDRVDLLHSKVYCDAQQEYAYDYLVMATGSEVNDYGVPGVGDHCHFFKSYLDVERLRRDLSATPPPAIAIIGGGPTGVELAFELHKAGYRDLALIEARGELVPTFSRKTAGLIAEELAAAAIKVHYNTPVIRVTADKLHTPAGVMPYDIAIWNCGIKPTVHADLPGGAGAVNRFLQYDPPLKNVFAIGDLSGKGPPTAQNAKQQGHYLADYFNGGVVRPYNYQEFAKVIHTEHALIVDKAGYGAFRFYKWLEPLYDVFL